MADATIDASRGAQLRSSHAYYVTGEDFLRIAVLGIGTQVVSVTGRVLDETGVVRPFRFDLPAPGNRATPATIIRSIGCGWLENVRAIALSAGTGLAQTYVVVDLVRGASAQGETLATLLAGYASSLVPIAWPESLLQSSITGPGVMRSILGTDPAAGAEISETVPAGARWRLVSIDFTLVTDATVANRRVHLLTDDGTNVYQESHVNVAQTATQSLRYSFAAGATLVGTDGVAVIGALPNNLILLGGHRLRTSTSGIVAGDNFGAPTYQVEEWLEGA